MPLKKGNRKYDKEGGWGKNKREKKNEEGGSSDLRLFCKFSVLIQQKLIISIIMLEKYSTSSSNNRV